MNQIPNIEEECNCTNFNKDIVDTSVCVLHQGDTHNTREIEEMVEYVAEVCDEVEFLHGVPVRLPSHTKALLRGRVREALTTLHQQLQKARKEERVQIANALVDTLPTGTIDAFEIIKAVKKFQESLLDQSELDQDRK